MSGSFVYVPIAVDHVYATIRMGAVLRNALCIGINNSRETYPL